MYEIGTVDVPSEGVAVFKNGKKVLETLNIGATLNHLSLRGSENIIDGYDKENLTSFAWSRSAILFPFPNRLRDGTYTHEGQSFQFPVNEESNHNALHGFVFAEQFELTQRIATETECTLSFILDYRGQYEYYPFPFKLQVEYKLCEAELLTTFSIQNIGEGKLPFGFGWHPYFVFDEKVDQLKIQLPKVHQILLDDRQLPTGETCAFDDYKELRHIGRDTFDTGFVVEENEYSVLIRNGEGLQIVLRAKNQPYLQVFTPDDRRRIAIEPMSSGIDVLNTKEGLKTLAPGEEVSFCTSIKVEEI